MCVCVYVRVCMYLYVFIKDMHSTQLSGISVSMHLAPYRSWHPPKEKCLYFPKGRRVHIQLPSPRKGTDTNIITLVKPQPLVPLLLMTPTPTPTPNHMPAPTITPHLHMHTSSLTHTRTLMHAHAAPAVQERHTHLAQGHRARTHTLENTHTIVDTHSTSCPKRPT